MLPVQYLYLLWKYHWILMMVSQQSWSSHEHIVQSQPSPMDAPAVQAAFIFLLSFRENRFQWKSAEHVLLVDVRKNGNIFSGMAADDRLLKTTQQTFLCLLTVFAAIWKYVAPHVFVLWQPAMSIHRIMHWARRIEQEIDRVFQHITGAQQLKGVSVWLSFYSIQVLLIAVLHKLNKTRTRQRVQYAKQL